MKLFFGILLAATVIGGFVGAEIMGTSFSILGAVIGGIGTAIILLGLGAYFDAQDKKSKELTPEMRDVFDRMITGKSHPTRQDIKTAKKNYPHTLQEKKSSKPDDLLSIEGAMRSLMAQDAAAIARGEIPEKRLVPHHAIKRDVIIAAYTKDFQVAMTQLQAMSWSDEEKKRRYAASQKDFDKKIYGIKRLGWEELDKIIALMKKTRTDFKEIEGLIRSKGILYHNIDPL